jgi:hypothetical protein
MFKTNALFFFMRISGNFDKNSTAKTIEIYITKRQQK